MKTPEALCQLGNLSCMGCCTSIRVRDKKVTETNLIINTKRFKLVKDPDKFSKESGYDVEPKSDMCKTLIKEGNKVFCPAHPMSPYTKGKDMRHFCDKKYWCPTMKRYLKWDNEIKEDFIKFIKSKKLDWYAYSKGMDNDSFLIEFIEQLK
jgi:hypothetical protein